MDDEIRHRFQENHTARNVALLALVNICGAALWEYFDPSDATKDVIQGIIAGATIGYLVRFFTEPKNRRSHNE